MHCVLSFFDTRCIVPACSQLSPTQPLPAAFEKLSPGGRPPALLRGMQAARLLWCGSGGIGTLCRRTIGRGSSRARVVAASHSSTPVCWRNWPPGDVLQRRENRRDRSAASHASSTAGTARGLAHDRALAGRYPVRGCRRAGRRIFQRGRPRGRGYLARIQPWHGRANRWPSVKPNSRR